MTSLYKIRSLDYMGAWATDHRRYYQYAEQGLEELIALAEKVCNSWPSDSPDILPVSEMPPELHRLCRQRDRVSDSVMLFAAIAVEAFINYYGIRRLGEKQFNRHVERLAIQRKLELLLLVCDSHEINETDPLIVALKAVVERRNRLAHPKAREVAPDQPPGQRSKEPIPDGATNAVQAMKNFFIRFVEIVPESKRIAPNESAA